MRTLARLVLALGLLAAPAAPALAQDPAMAEKFRLEEEMKKLAQRNAWAGVERNYEALVALKVPLSFEDHFLGAQSAGYLGKTWERYNRLEKALELEDKDELRMEKENILTRYGRVDIKGHPRRRPDLVAKEMPFAPDERKSVEYAMTVVAGAGSFKGMLPEGEYTVGDQTFKVTPGQDFATIEVGKSAGVAREGLVIYAGPVATIGYAYSASPEPSQPPDADPSVVQPDSMAASGAALNVGAEVGFTRMFGVAGTIGYRGAYGVDVVHGFNGWLAAALRPGDLRLAAGPTYGMVRGSGLGVAGWFDRNQNPVEDPVDGIPYYGYALVGGAQASVGYGLVDLEPLQGVVELVGSWQTDGLRPYYSFGLRIGIWPKVPRFEG